MIKGLTFTQNYEASIKIYKGLSADNMIELLHNWSKKVVEVLTELNDEFNYKVTVTLEPNPPAFKGVDNVNVDVWKTRREPHKGVNGELYYDKPYIYMRSGTQMSLEACINKMNAQMDELLDRMKPPTTIELGGKKYRLVEEK